MSDTDQTRAARFAAGKQVLDAIDGEAGQNVIDSLSDIAPELGHQIVAWGFGDIYARPDLQPAQRQLVTLGALTALGGCEAQLEVHIGAASYGSSRTGITLPCWLAHRDHLPPRRLS